MPDVITVGEALASLRVPTTVSPGMSAALSMAGAEANVAVGLSRLGHPVAFVGAVGDDALGRLVSRSLRAEAVEAYLRVSPSATGVVVFTHRLPGVIAVDYHRRESAGATLCTADISAALVSSARIVHVSGVTPALSESACAAVTALVDTARVVGATVSFDVNFRAKLWSRRAAHPVLRRLATKADIVIGSVDELDLAAAPGAADPIAALAGEGKEVVVKRGAAGASLVTRSARIDAPGLAVIAVDAIGAGDAFVAGYLSGVLDGLAKPERLARGCAAGAFAVSQAGDWEGLPTRSELPLIEAADGTAVR